jgi:hypothetical protein
MASPTSPDDWQPQLQKVVARLEKLEAEVFPPGPPGLGAQLAKLGKELKDLERRVTDENDDLKETISKTIRIVAELKELVARPGSKPRAQPG